MEIKEYSLGETLVKYLIDDDKNVVMLLIPSSSEADVKQPWNTENDKFDTRARYMHQWNIGSLAYIHLKGYNQSLPGTTMKNRSLKFIFESQTCEKKDECTKIVTLLKSDKGYKISHTLTYYVGLRGFVVETEFINESGSEAVLQMLSSFALDNLSPFQEDDGADMYKLHRFYGGWSKEGKHICQTIEELALEKTWAGFNGNSEKFGCIGSYPVKRYFPTAVFEDSGAGVLWAAQLAVNSTWEMELTRTDDTLSFTGGLGDRDFCGWERIVNNNESFKAPKAYIAAVKGDIFDVCSAVTDMQKPAYREYGEKGLPVCFNEYCATWGRPTQDKMLSYCNALKEYGIKYLVIDAGWSKKGCEQDSNGEWNVDKSIFPDMKQMNKTIRENGMIPGIWFEFEVTTSGSKMYGADFDFMHLKKDGYVLKTGNFRSYWDFRREDVREYLHEKVIELLKKYEFGYIKVDYNANIGIGVDGAESGAEGLRQHLECVRDFFVQMKKEIPDLIIENCASGGHRLEPSMLEVSAVSSFSDAHEAVEIPYIAANLHNLMLPAQSLIWAVLHSDDSKERLIYSLSSTFLGRMCLSGEIDSLPDDSKKILKQSVEFYGKLEDIIKNGETKIYGNRGGNSRYPTGTQIAVRKTDTQILVVCHAFDNPSNDVEIEIPSGFSVKDTFYAESTELRDGLLKVGKMSAFTGNAVLLEK